MARGSQSRSPMALTYLRGHDRGSVSQPEIVWVSSATDRKWLSQTRPLGSSRSPHTDRYFSLSHILSRKRAPSSPSLRSCAAPHRPLPSRASTSAILIALSPPVSRSLASAHALALISPGPWAHFPSPTGLSRDMPDLRRNLVPGRGNISRCPG